MELMETARTYSGRLRRRYEAAAESLGEWPLCSRDARLSPFLKAEKLHPGKVHKPRMIMPRSPRYNLVLASHLKKFEHEFYNRWRVAGLEGRVVAKGLNAVQRANLIRRKFDSIEGCVVVEVDGAQFEAHVSREMLELEHSVYVARYPDLASVLRKQLVLEGKTSCGIRFRREGARASGDFNTGLGNTLCMGAMVLATTPLVVRGKWDTLVDGDNCLLFLSPSDVPNIMTRFAPLAQRLSGFECTIESPVTVLEHITFGQSKPVFDGVSYRMVRDPWKVMSNSLSTYRFHDAGFRRHLFGGVALCEIAANRGVPVLQSFFTKALRAFGHPKIRALAHLEEYHYLLGSLFDTTGVTREVVPRARSSFELAFGISPVEQRRLELRPFEVENSARVLPALGVYHSEFAEPGVGPLATPF